MLKTIPGAEEVAQQLGTVAGLSEDLDLIPRTYMVDYTHQFQRI